MLSRVCMTLDGRGGERVIRNETRALAFRYTLITVYTPVYAYTRSYVRAYVRSYTIRRYLVGWFGVSPSIPRIPRIPSIRKCADIPSILDIPRTAFIESASPTSSEASR